MGTVEHALESGGVLVVPRRTGGNAGASGVVGVGARRGTVQNTGVGLQVIGSGAKRYAAHVERVLVGAAGADTGAHPTDKVEPGRRRRTGRYARPTGSLGCKSEGIRGTSANAKVGGTVCEVGTGTGALAARSERVEEEAG